MDDSALLLVEFLRNKGCAYVSPLKPRQLDDVNEYFSSKPVFPDAHVPETARKNGVHVPISRYLVPHTECFCVSTDDAILAPYLLEHALVYTDVAADYLGVEMPVMYSANAFWTRPGTAPNRPDIQDFHCDIDDTKFLALFIMLTDTEPDDGAQELEGPDGVVRQIYGSAGSCFLADTSRRHRGNKPRRRERGIVWFRWGVSERPAANQWDHIEPIDKVRLGVRYPTDERLQRSIRLLAA